MIGLVLGVLGIFFCIGKLLSRHSKNYYRNLFRGHLWEDYIRDNPDLVRNGRVACRCGNTSIQLRNLDRSGTDVVREHVCNQCGTRLYLSASGEELEAIVGELKKEGRRLENSSNK